MQNEQPLQISVRTKTVPFPTLWSLLDSAMEPFRGKLSSIMFHRWHASGSKTGLVRSKLAATSAGRVDPMGPGKVSQDAAFLGSTSSPSAQGRQLKQDCGVANL